MKKLIPILLVLSSVGAQAQLNVSTQICVAYTQARMERELALSETLNSIAAAAAEAASLDPDDERRTQAMNEVIDGGKRLIQQRLVVNELRKAQDGACE